LVNDETGYHPPPPGSAPHESYCSATVALKTNHPSDC
jgi:hypothetical protein